jgi:MFS family permease
MSKIKSLNKEKIKHDEEYCSTKVNAVGIISFLMGFTQATIIYMMSSYFKAATGSEQVGFFYFIAYLIVFVALLNFHRAVKAIGKSNAFYFSLLFKIIVIAVLILAPMSIWVAPLLVFFLIFSGLEWASLDVILESFSVDRKSGRIRGKHLTFLNAGFIFGPLLATRLLDRFDFNGIFLFIFIINSIILIITLVSFRSINHRFEEKVSARELIMKFCQRKNILKIYYVSFILEFFFAVMVVYSPIYLRDLGLSWDKIGIIFTAMLVPFVLVQYPMGLLADKKTGEKEALIFSIFIMGASSAVIYFISGTGLFTWAIVLFATRIGAALIEVLRDSYFYKRIDSHDVDLIHFYRTAMPAGYIAASMFSVVILAFFPLKTLFLLLAVLVFSALIPAFFLLDNKSEKEMLLVK